jgi:S-adenosylmethionine-diacylglycerol 3-amino-3-carboxypropyl transferase
VPDPSSSQAAALVEGEALFEGKPRNTRLKQAVHQSRAVSRAGLLERMFTWVFSGLVYPQIWEDPVIDLEAMELTPDCHIVTIASGGCNVMSYLAAGPAHITAVDLNSAHVALTKLKLAGAAHLPSHEHYFRFFGLADKRENLSVYTQFLHEKLDKTTLSYWRKRNLNLRPRITLFTRNFYRHGLLGYFIGWAHLAARLLGVNFKPLLAARTLAEQRVFFDTQLAPLFDNRIVRWITDNKASLYGLGIPPAQYEKLSGGRPMHVVLRERLERLTCDFDISDNYFAWQAFARRYAPGEGASLPPYLQRENFAALQANAGRVDVLNKGFTEFLSSQPPQSCDRYVLLDAQDWMTDAQLNDLWSEITRTARPGARVIFRTAAEPSLLPGRVLPELLARWRYHEEESFRWTYRDRSSIYGGFHLYTFEG